MEVLTGMSNVHSLGDISTNFSTVVERQIMAVAVASVFTTTSSAIKLQDSMEGSSALLVAALKDQKVCIDYNNKAEEHH